jgi:hypothetical protein
MAKGSGGATSGGTGKGRQRPRIDASGSAGSGPTGKEPQLKSVKTSGGESFSRGSVERELRLGGEFNQALSGPQKEALNAYVGADFVLMNGALRGNLTAVEKGIFKKETRYAQYNQDLIKALDRPVGENLIVSRGMQSQTLVDMANAGNIIGATIQEKGFMSTSLQSGVSRNFLKFQGPRVMMRIQVPKTAKGAVLGSKETAFEREVLLKPGTTIQVMRARFGKSMGPGDKIIKTLYISAKVV